MVRRVTISGCPCGEDHSFGPDEKWLRKAGNDRGDTLTIESVLGAIYQIPRVWVAAHGLDYDALPELAERYGWEKKKA